MKAIVPELDQADVSEDTSEDEDGEDQENRIPHITHITHTKSTDGDTSTGNATGSHTPKPPNTTQTTPQRNWSKSLAAISIVGSLRSKLRSKTEFMKTQAHDESESDDDDDVLDSVDSSMLAKALSPAQDLTATAVSVSDVSNVNASIGTTKDRSKTALGVAMDRNMTMSRSASIENEWDNRNRNITLAATPLNPNLSTTTATATTRYPATAPGQGATATTAMASTNLAMSVGLGDGRSHSHIDGGQGQVPIDHGQLLITPQFVVMREEEEEEEEEGEEEEAQEEAVNVRNRWKRGFTKVLEKRKEKEKKGQAESISWRVFLTKSGIISRNDRQLPGTYAFDISELRDTHDSHRFLDREVERLELQAEFAKAMKTSAMLPVSGVIEGLTSDESSDLIQIWASTISATLSQDYALKFKSLNEHTMARSLMLSSIAMRKAIVNHCLTNKDKYREEAMKGAFERVSELESLADDPVDFIDIQEDCIATTYSTLVHSTINAASLASKEVPKLLEYVEIIKTISAAAPERDQTALNEPYLALWEHRAKLVMKILSIIQGENDNSCSASLIASVTSLIRAVPPLIDPEHPLLSAAWNVTMKVLKMSHRFPRLAHINDSHTHTSPTPTPTPYDFLRELNSMYAHLCSPSVFTEHEEFKGRSEAEVYPLYPEVCMRLAQYALDKSSSSTSTTRPTTTPDTTTTAGGGGGDANGDADSVSLDLMKDVESFSATELMLRISVPLNRRNVSAILEAWDRVYSAYSVTHSVAETGQFLKKSAADLIPYQCMPLLDRIKRDMASVTNRRYIDFYEQYSTQLAKCARTLLHQTDSSMNNNDSYMTEFSMLDDILAFIEVQTMIEEPLEDKASEELDKLIDIEERFVRKLIKSKDWQRATEVLLEMIKILKTMQGTSSATFDPMKPPPPHYSAKGKGKGKWSIGLGVSAKRGREGNEDGVLERQSYLLYRETELWRLLVNTSIQLSRSTLSDLDLTTDDTAVDASTGVAVSKMVALKSKRRQQALSAFQILRTAYQNRPAYLQYDNPSLVRLWDEITKDRRLDSLRKPFLEELFSSYYWELDSVLSNRQIPQLRTISKRALKTQMNDDLKAERRERQVRDSELGLGVGIGDSDSESKSVYSEDDDDDEIDLDTDLKLVSTSMDLSRDERILLVLQHPMIILTTLSLGLIYSKYEASYNLKQSLHLFLSCLDVGAESINVSHSHSNHSEKNKSKNKSKLQLSVYPSQAKNTAKVTVTVAASTATATATVLHDAWRSAYHVARRFMNHFQLMEFVKSELKKRVLVQNLDPSHPLIQTIEGSRTTAASDDVGKLRWLYQIRKQELNLNLNPATATATTPSPSTSPFRLIELNEEYAELFFKRGARIDASFLLTESLESLRVYDGIVGASGSVTNREEIRYLDIRLWHRLTEVNSAMAVEHEHAGELNEALQLYVTSLRLRTPTLDPLDQHLDSIVDMILELLHQSQLDLGDIEILDPTDTDAFRWMISEYEGYRVELLDIYPGDAAGSGTHNKDFARMHHDSSETLKVKLPLFKQLILRYPHMGKICQLLGQLFASAQQYQLAIRYSRHALHFFTVSLPTTHTLIKDQWSECKSIFISQRHTTTELVEFMHDELIVAQALLEEPHSFIDLLRNEYMSTTDKVAMFDKYVVGLVYYIVYIGIVVTLIFWNPLSWFLALWQSTEVYAYFLVMSIDMVLIVLSLYFIAWPTLPADGKQRTLALMKRTHNDLKDATLMIACHRSQAVIYKTLKAALWVFPPEKIFICDNGNSQSALDRTIDVCARVTREYQRERGIPASSPGINYIWIPEGNKTLAFWFTLENYNKSKYVMMIDDDVMLPPDIMIPVSEFSDTTKALAFTICAENIRDSQGKLQLIPLCQDVEYKLAGFQKMFQSYIGTAISAHGAISMWDREVLKAVFWDHNTMFHGEDLQMGLILQKLNRNYRMETIGSVTVPTVVPDHFICRHGLNCPHETGSLLKQRVLSWDATIHRFVPTLLKIVLYFWKRTNLIVKPFLLYELWTILQDYLRYPLMVYYLYLTPDTFLLGLGILLVFQLVIVSMFNAWTFRFRPDLRVPWLTVAIFPFYRLIVLFFRFLALFYNLLYYLPFVRTRTKIKDRRDLPLGPQDVEILHEKSTLLPAMPIGADDVLIEDKLASIWEKCIEHVSEGHHKPRGELVSHWFFSVLGPMIRSPYDPSVPFSQITGGTAHSSSSTKLTGRERQIDGADEFFYLDADELCDQLILVESLNIACFLSDRERCFGGDLDRAIRILKWMWIEYLMVDDDFRTHDKVNVLLDDFDSMAYDGNGVSPIRLAILSRDVILNHTAALHPDSPPHSPYQMVLLWPKYQQSEWCLEGFSIMDEKINDLGFSGRVFKVSDGPFLADLGVKISRPFVIVVPIDLEAHSGPGSGSGSVHDRWKKIALLMVHPMEGWVLVHTNTESASCGGAYAVLEQLVKVESELPIVQFTVMEKRGQMPASMMPLRAGAQWEAEKYYQTNVDIEGEGEGGGAATEGPPSSSSFSSSASESDTSLTDSNANDPDNILEPIKIRPIPEEPSLLPDQDEQHPHPQRLPILSRTIASQDPHGRRYSAFGGSIHSAKVKPPRSLILPVNGNGNNLALGGFRKRTSISGLARAAQSHNHSHSYTATPTQFAAASTSEQLAKTFRDAQAQAQAQTQTQAHTLNSPQNAVVPSSAAAAKSTATAIDDDTVRLRSKSGFADIVTGIEGEWRQRNEEDMEVPTALLGSGSAAVTSNENENAVAVPLAIGDGNDGVVSESGSESYNSENDGEGDGDVDSVSADDDDASDISEIDNVTRLGFWLKPIVEVTQMPILIIREDLETVDSDRLFRSFAATMTESELDNVDILMFWELNMGNGIEYELISVPHKAPYVAEVQNVADEHDCTLQNMLREYLKVLRGHIHVNESDSGTESSSDSDLSGSDSDL